MEFFNASDYWYGRLLFERSLAAIYLIAFVVALNQFLALLGEKGLLPVPQFLKYVPFKSAPSLFHWKYSDGWLRFVCWVGMILSFAVMTGFFGRAPIAVHMLVWLLLYGFYLSITNVGQTFYGFGWESMLCEAGFFMAFMGPEWVTPSWIPILALRWMLFRTELGAGLIKIRGDACWRDLTCLFYHHETQPMPNPVSRTFHHLPKAVLKGGVVFSHWVQLVVPFGLFLPQPFAGVAAVLIISHQFLLVVSGNYSWLNWITIILGFLAIPDWGAGAMGAPRPLWFDVVLLGLGVFTLFLSYRPALNLVAKRQRMNFCWNRYHLVGAYGAFGSVTKKRYEIVIEGTHDGVLGEETEWLEYEFKAKPGDLSRRPPQMAPYHLRLDWLMWFLPFSVLVGEGEVYVYEHEVWFLRFIQKLLENDGPTLALIRKNPFEKNPPKHIRAKFYLYEFTNAEEFKQSGHYWKREFKGMYLPPVRHGNGLHLA